jgi:hypothetical protein
MTESVRALKLRKLLVGFGRPRRTKVHPMKIKILSVFLTAAGLLATGATAQVTTPTRAPVVTSDAPSTVNRVIYSPRLPSANELSNVAAAQGLSVERIDQTDSQITATYRSSNGQLSTVSYQLLPNGSDATATTVVTTPAPNVVYTSPAPRVVYRTAPSYYYYNDPFFYPWGGYGYYSPVSVSLGFGFGHGYYGGRGYYHGGYHGGYHGRHR